MMKMRWLFALFALWIAGCGGADKGGDSGGATDTDGETHMTHTDMNTMDDAEIAAALWDEIQGYDSWGQTEGWGTEPVESGDHLGAYVVAYYNDALVNWSFSGEAPEGSISVKEGWVHEGSTGCNPCGTACNPCGTTGCNPCGTTCNPCGTTACSPCGTTGGDGELVIGNFTVMKKVPGYAPDDGDWFWAQYSVDGDVLEMGQPQMCVGCHAAAATDYVYGAPPE